MKLLFAPASPYARKVRVTIAEKALMGIELVPVRPFESPAVLLAANPLGKVPALLLEDGSALYDSSVICEYLDTLSGAAPLVPPSGPGRWTVLRRRALTDGMMDATFSIACEITRRPAHERSQSWIDRWRATLDRSLDVLDREIASYGSDISLAHIGAGCALAYLDLRASSLIEWRANRANIEAWFSDFEKRPSMISTRPEA